MKVNLTPVSPEEIYDVAPKRGRWIRVIETFLSMKTDAVKLDAFDSNAQAKTAYNSLTMLVNRKNYPVKVSKRENIIFLMKK